MNSGKMCLKSPGTDVGAAGFERCPRTFETHFTYLEQLEHIFSAEDICIIRINRTAAQNVFNLSALFYVVLPNEVGLSRYGVWMQGESQHMI